MPRHFTTAARIPRRAGRLRLHELSRT
jgi:hypothetical protein